MEIIATSCFLSAGSHPAGSRCEIPVKKGISVSSVHAFQNKSRNVTIVREVFLFHRDKLCYEPVFI